MNLANEVGRLKDGENLGVEFYNNGVVGDYSKAFSRNLDEHQKFSQFELIEKCCRPQDHNHVLCFGQAVTPKDEKNRQNSLTDSVDALESNYQKKIEEMQTAHERYMAKMKESHQQDLAKMEDAHHKDMATIGDKLKLLAKLGLQQRSHEMYSSGMYH
ncbi:hypothetical protein Cgig2_015273 [Carnegiea gigantea]|uniref:Uncharacterized protein n=1 Tax=Carnegiea gigantea TaxID=171969 RepID=A0A9Q1QE94_9CARY|nr:hypothetical protein Cgig2_015273 [Carnegiea gigantea]